MTEVREVLFCVASDFGSLTNGNLTAQNDEKIAIDKDVGSVVLLEPISDGNSWEQDTKHGTRREDEVWRLQKRPFAAMPNRSSICIKDRTLV